MSKPGAGRLIRAGRRDPNLPGRFVAVHPWNIDTALCNAVDQVDAPTVVIVISAADPQELKTSHQACESEAMDGNRALRRAHDRRMKARAKVVMKRWYGRRPVSTDPREIGRNASTHCRPCGCWMCQYDEREVPPPRERAFDDLDPG
ncbi:MAG TPA: hypothetical protein VGG72_09140 [Bryobacteraceae bacterium]|jgi:hypothetical protein